MGEKVERKAVKARGDVIFRTGDESIFLDYNLPW